MLKGELDSWALHPQEKTWRDIRTLLATLQDVLWEEAKWTGPQPPTALQWQPAPLGVVFSKHFRTVVIILICAFSPAFE